MNRRDTPPPPLTRAPLLRPTALLAACALASGCATTAPVAAAKPTPQPTTQTTAEPDALQKTLAQCSASAQTPPTEAEVASLREAWRARFTPRTFEDKALGWTTASGKLRSSTDPSRLVRGVDAWRWVDEVGFNVLEKAGHGALPWTFIVTTRDQPTLASGPWGLIALSAPQLVALPDESHLAFALAHEAAHCLLGHWDRTITAVRERLCTAKALSDAIDAQTPARSHGQADPATSAIATVFDARGHEAEVFDQDQELAADALAFELVRDAGYDPRVTPAAVTRLSGAQFVEPRATALRELVSAWKAPARFRPPDVRARLARQK
jgi:predicted Zn-dependent protease